MDPKGLVVTKNAYFSLLTHIKQLLLVTFCDPTAGIGVSFRTHGRTDGRTECEDRARILETEFAKRCSSKKEERKKDVRASVSRVMIILIL